MASYPGPGISSPVYDVSQSIEVNLEDGSPEEQINEEQSVEKVKAESTDSMLDIIVVTVEADGNESVYDEKEAVLIDDGRMPCKGDAIIDLNIDTEALFFVSSFLLVTLQRIPRHCSDKVKTVFTIAQLFVVLGMFMAIAYDMGAFPGTRTLENSQWDNFVTSVKNVICNAKYPFLYMVGIFYFRSRHLENMLANVRITKRYWNYGRKTLSIMIGMVFLFTVVIPVVCNTARMLLPNRANAQKGYNIKGMAISCVISLVVRSMSLSIVFASILAMYLIYCQVRLFKEQIQKWPRECMSFARDSYINVCKMVRNSERAFQPFLVVHFIILLVLLIPLTISCVEQFEAQGSYTKTVTRSNSIPYGIPGTSAPITEVLLAQNDSALVLHLSRHKHLVPYLVFRNKTKNSWMDEFNKHKRTYQETHANTRGIIRVALMILAEILETAWLYGLLVLLIGKVDKSMRQIRDTVRMLKYGQQREKSYMFQNAEDISAWDSILSDARGIQVMGFNLASFKAALLMLLFPFVTTVFRFMLRHVNIKP